MLLSLVVGLIFGVTIQGGYNIAQVPIEVKTVTVERVVAERVEVPVEVIVEKIIKVKPKSIICKPVVEY